MLKVNLIADTDAYKQGHWSMINPGLEYQYTYGEARVKSKYPVTVMFGMQVIISKYLSQPVTQEDLEEAVELSTIANGYNTVNVEAWQKIIDNGGKIPITIKSAPEGSIVPIDNVLFVLNSNEEFFAKEMNILEPLIMHIWYPSSLATRSLFIYNSILPLFQQSGDEAVLPYMVNDFGLRGATTRESAIIAGMSHLLLFRGSDNLPSVRGVIEYYSITGKLADCTFKEDILSTVKASEHSVPLSYGNSKELEYLKNFINSLPKDKMGSVVIDTYDTIGFIKNIVSNKEIVEMIKAREAKLIFRPDSGDFRLLIPTLLQLLESIFGSTVNEKGYRVLNHVSLIQGDGMDEQSIPELYQIVLNTGFACSNLAVGSGGGLHQKDITRDTQRFAIKPSFGIINGEQWNFMKAPKTDLTKASKPGMLKLSPTHKGYTTISSNDTMSFDSYVDVLQVVFENGELKNFKEFPEVRANLMRNLEFVQF